MWWDERKVVFGDVGVAVAPATAGPTRVDPAGTLIVDLDCSYTRASVLRAVRDRARTPWRVVDLSHSHAEADDDGEEAVRAAVDEAVGAGTPAVYWGEYERIDWDRVGSGALRANCYCIRKGLIRKAQLALSLAKWALKRPGSLLARATPETHCFELYDIEYFDEVLIADVPELRDLGNGEAASDQNDEAWIVKPNVANQAIGVVRLTRDRIARASHTPPPAMCP